MGFFSKVFGGITHLVSSVLSPILGGDSGGSTQTVVEPQTISQPTIVDEGKEETQAIQNNRKKRAQNAGFTSNILAGDDTSGSTGKKTLLGE